MKPAIFIASTEDKAKAQEICNKVIEIIQSSSKEVLFRAYVMQMLLESFEEIYNIDIRRGYSVSKMGGRQDGKQIF